VKILRILFFQRAKCKRQWFESSIEKKKGWKNSVIRCRHKDGTIKFLESTAQPSFDSKGNLTGFIGIDRDITERKRTEVALWKSEKELSIRNRITEIFIKVPDDKIYFEVLQVVLEAMESPYGTFAYINEDGDRVVPVLTRDIWAECKVQKVDPVFPRERWSGIWGKCLINKETVSSSGPFRVPEGHIPITKAMAVPIIYQGEPIGNFMVANKTTDYCEKDKELLESIAGYLAPILHIRLQKDRQEERRKRSEESLKRSEEKYRTLFEAESDAIFIVDEETADILDANEAALQLYGYSHEEITALRAMDLSAEPEKTTITIRVPGKSFVPVRYHRKKDRTVFVVEIASNDFELNGRRTNVSLVRDITERKRLEEELLKAQKLESLGVFAGGIAHDFNNILTTILGNVSMAKMGVSPEDEMFDLLNEAEMASTRAQRLTKQLLTFAKGGAPVKEIASIKAILKESSSFVLRGSKSSCEFSIAEDLWSAEVDIGQISQVINNIVINANQAMPEGGIIRVAAENLIIDDGQSLPLKPGRYIRISIKDQGVGIAEKHLVKIFDPYFTTKYAGSGLGLATSYSIIKKHDGHITVESRLGVGTTFYIYLLASDKAIPEKEKFKVIKGQGKILVMDDVAALRKIAGRILEKLGYEPEFAKNGAEAIRMYKEAKEAEKPYDAVILDLTIPGGMGGKDAVNKLLEIDPEVKAIVSSGYSEDPVLAKFQEYGFKGMMPKPFTSQSLSKVLHEVLQGEKE